MNAQPDPWINSRPWPQQAKAPTDWTELRKWQDRQESTDKKMKKKVASKDLEKYKSFVVYTKSILKNSLITSVPEITATKSWVKKIIKIFVILISTVGFLYQTWNFLKLYLAYPTVVNVLVSNPYEVQQPALTFCNKNRQRRTVVCSYENSECTVMPFERFCDTYPKYCPDNLPPYLGAPFLNSFVMNEFWWEDSEIEAHNDSIIGRCYKIIEGKRRKCKLPYRRVPSTTSAGEPNMCYTIDSQMEQPKSQADIYPNTFTFEVELNTQPEEYMIYTEPVLIQVAIHDRKREVNAFAEGYALKGGRKYEAYVSMTEKKLLPAPYDTNCTDYLKIWRENNGTGPLNELMCIEYCKLTTLLEQGKCIDKNVLYPHMEELCYRGQISATSDIIENCTLNCRNPCSDHQYEVRYEEVNNFDVMCVSYWCKISKIKLSVFFKRFQVTKYVYQPKFESVEMFSYIGGYMGMWLGLSLVSLFDLIETLVYLFYYPVGHLRWHSKRTKTTPLFQKTKNYSRELQVY